MILSHTHKFIFFCSSRVATTSMEEALGSLQEGAEYDLGLPESGIPRKHVPPAILRGALQETIWEEYFKFVFVRNPWDWFISQLYYNWIGPYARAAAPSVSPPRKRAWRALPRQLSKPRPEPSGRPPDDLVVTADQVDTVFEFLKRFKGLPGRDGLYQSNWVFDMDDRLIVDYVGRYETLDADFQAIMRHLNLDIRLPHLNAVPHRDYRSYYSHEARERVGELWAIDVENFGYVFEPPEATREGRVGQLDPSLRTAPSQN